MPNPMTSLSPSTSSSSSRPVLPSLLLVPPLRYSLVEDNLHRGSYPTLRNLPFLARLHLKTVVSLTPEPPTADLRAFCRDEGIELHHHAVAQPVEGVSVPAAVLSAVMAVVVELERLPVYVHCLDGRAVTGVVVACLRRLQWWAAGSVVEEYGRFTDSVEGCAVAEAWKGPLRVPRNLPWWLWEGKHVKEHPAIALLDATLDKDRADGAGERRKAKVVPPDAGAGEAEEAAAQEEARALSVTSRWGAQRSWLYYDTLTPLQGDPRPYIAHPSEPEERYTEDTHPRGASMFLEALALEGFTMTNTFVSAAPALTLPGTAECSGILTLCSVCSAVQPRPLHLFHVGAHASAASLSGVEQAQAG